MTKAIFASDNWIQDEEGKLKGQICIRPDVVLRRRASKQKWRTVPIDKFIKWMETDGKEVKKDYP